MARGDSGGSPPRKVLLVGWDAADWRVIRPLLEAGQMPVLESLVDQGVMADLATLHPPLSPMLWTSVATGMRPFKHGVLGFTEPAPDGRGIQPVSSGARKVKAIWNILSQTGLRSSIVGWWPSHPAEPIRGAMVSNVYHQAFRAHGEPWPLPPGTVHPSRLSGMLADLRLHPGELTAEHLLPFVPRVAEIDQDRDPRVAMCMKILAECTSIHSAATWLLEHEPWEFMAVYYDALDHWSHAFMRYHPPRQTHVPERDVEFYGGVVGAAYRYHDLMLGRLLHLAGPQTTVLLVSDHGFHPDHLRPRSIPREPAGPAAEHRDFGIFVMKGPGIRADEYLHGVSLLDITPTILTLFCLPVGEDMDGKPLVQAFDTPPSIATVPTWEAVPGEAGLHPLDRRIEPLDARGALDRLVALGYIDPPDSDADRAVASTVRELRYNLARAYMDTDRHVEAAEILEALHLEAAGEYRFGIQLAMCYRALERIGPLRALVQAMNGRRRDEAVAARRRLEELAAIARARRAMRVKPGTESAGPAGDGSGNGAGEPVLSEAERDEVRRLSGLARVSTYALDYLMGFVLAAEGKPEAALECLARAEAAEPGRPGLHIQIGEAYLRLGRWDDADRAFAKAAEIDPDNPHAHLGLCKSLLPRRQNGRAAEEALTAVRLLYHYPLAHYCLGVALHRLGRIERAVEALEVAVALNPAFPEAHRRLAQICERRLRDPERAATHRRLAEEAVARPRRALEPPARSTLAAPGSQTGAPSAPRAHVLGPVGHRDRITIVSGLPRSGTSLLMQMLQTGGLPVLTDHVRAPDPDNPRGYLEFEPVKRTRQDPSWLDGAVGKAVKMVHLLLLDLPLDRPYNVVMASRDLDEILASQRTMLERRGCGSEGRATDGLGRVFRQQIALVRAHLESHPNFTVLDVDYNRLLENPRPEVDRLITWLGLPNPASAMLAQIDPSLYRSQAPALAG